MDIFSFHFLAEFVCCWNGDLVEELSKVVLAHLKLLWSPLTTLDIAKYQI